MLLKIRLKSASPSLNGTYYVNGPDDFYSALGFSILATGDAVEIETNEIEKELEGPKELYKLLDQIAPLGYAVQFDEDNNIIATVNNEY